MITDNELFAMYSIRSFEVFFNSVKDRRENIEYRNQAILGSDNYKKLREELYPLYEYVKLKYKSDEVEFKLEPPNSPFDASVYRDNIIIEQIELTYPRNGEEENEDAKYLVERGYGEIRDWGGIPRNSAIEIIRKSAEKKAKKNYSNKTLIVVINQYPLWDLSDPDDEEEIQILANTLKKIEYCAKSVILFVMPISTSDGYISGKVFKIC